MERLDKFLANAEVLTRSQCKVAIKRKLISVNGEIVKTFTNVHFLPN